MKRSRIALAALLVPLLCAQTPDVRFKVQAATVVVDVIVTDGKGNLVPGLTAADFQIFENKVPQKILSFEAPAGTGGSPVAAVQSSGAVQPAGAERVRSQRMITLVIDQSAMRGASLKTSIDTATQYVENAIGPEDYVAIYSVTSALRLVVPFSRDKQKMLDGIKSLNRGSQGIQTGRDRDRAATDVQALANQVQQLNEAGDPASKAMAAMAETERLTILAETNMLGTYQTRELFRALRAIAQASGTLPGRKNVVLFSEGLPTNAESADGVASVVDAANHANVAFYVIDPSGISQDNFAGNFDAGNGSNGKRGASTRSGQDLANTMRGPQVVAGQTKFDQLFSVGPDGNSDGLRSVAEKTGGLLIKNRNDLKSSLDRIDRDLREFYTLTYQSANSEYDGTYREIRVDVPGRHTLRYRKGYYALVPGEEIKVTPASAQLLASVAAGTLKPSVKSKLTASTVFGPLETLSVPVSVWLPGDQRWVTKNDKGFSSGITMVITARDAEGHILDVFQKFVDAQWSKEEWKTVEKKGIQVLANLTVPKLEPLEVQAVFQFSNGSSAQENLKLALPAGGDKGARLTSLFLTPRVDASPDLKDGEPEALHIGGYQLSVPAEMRFGTADKLTLYFGMDAVSIVPETGSPRIGLTIALKSGDKVIRELPADSLYPWPHTKDRIFFLNQFDLAGLPAGTYTVQATLKDLATQTTAVNAMNFSIQ